VVDHMNHHSTEAADEEVDRGKGERLSQQISAGIVCDIIADAAINFLQVQSKNALSANLQIPHRPQKQTQAH
jgi:hypothetical protein